MKTFRLLVMVLTATLLIAALDNSLVAAPITYQAFQIGPQGATGLAMNAAGQVTGVWNGSVFVYTPGTGISSLGMTGVGSGINGKGQVVANSANGPFVYTPGQGATDLGLGNQASARGINASGQITGFAATPTGQQAFIYTPGSGFTYLGDDSGANAINDHGQVTGFSGFNAFLYTPGTGLVDLDIFGTGLAINDIGQVAGNGDNGEAFLYTPGVGIAGLGTLYGELSYANGVNDTGQVVGMVSGYGLERAFLYTGSQMYDLNNLITGGLAAGDSLDDALAINDNGWILAYGDGTSYLLEPNAMVPEPASLPLLGLGVGLLGLCRLVRRKPLEGCGRPVTIEANLYFLHEQLTIASRRLSLPHKLPSQGKMSPASTQSKPASPAVLSSCPSTMSPPTDCPGSPTAAAARAIWMRQG